MSDVFVNQRDKVAHNVDGVIEGLRQMDAHFRQAKSGDVDLQDELLIKAGRSLVQISDPKHGGFGTKPKFPTSSAHALLARAGKLPFGGPAQNAFLLAAKKICRGGIYDHLGGGFSRYSVDERWLVPHFEKMLYDNGQLLEVCADAFALTEDEDYRDTIQQTVQWMSREMRDPSGGLYASQDADTEGIEGKYYVWSPDQIRDVLGPANAILFCAAYGGTEHGNFEHGLTVLSRISERGGVSDERALTEMRKQLFVHRCSRIAPDKDTRVLSGWNGLAMMGLLRAWQVLDDSPALGLAKQVGAFLAEAMVSADSTRLSRVFKDGVTKLDGTIDDYAFCSLAFFHLAECTGEKKWWDLGSKLLDSVLQRFYDEDEGVFYLISNDADSLLMHRPESHHDGAMPAGAAVTVECLIRRNLLVGDERGGADCRAISQCSSFASGRQPDFGGAFTSRSGPVSPRCRCGHCRRYWWR